MHIGHLLLVAMLPATISASAQDWQHCKPDGSYSFTEVKDTNRRVTTSHIVTSWDDKAFNRSGDLVSLAIVQTLTDKEMTSPRTLQEVLSIIREAFACPSRFRYLKAALNPFIPWLHNRSDLSVS